MYKDNIREIFNKMAEPGRNIIVFDTETSGFSPKKDFLLSVSGLKLKYDFETEKFQEIDRIDLFMKPYDGFAVPKAVSDVNHITTEVLKEKPLETDVIPEVYRFFGDGSIIVGHNVNFDINFMDAAFQRVLKQHFKYEMSFDTMKVAKEIISKDETPDYKLGTIAQKFGVTEGLEFHNSMDDVIATVRVLEHLLIMFINENKDTVNTGQKVKVLGAAYWCRYGHKRIYIQNNRVAMIYYDLDLDKWVQRGGEQIDTADIEKQCREMYQCNIRDLCKKIPSNE